MKNNIASQKHSRTFFYIILYSYNNKGHVCLFHINYNKLLYKQKKYICNFAKLFDQILVQVLVYFLLPSM